MDTQNTKSPIPPHFVPLPTAHMKIQIVDFSTYHTTSTNSSVNTHSSTINKKYNMNTNANNAADANDDNNNDNDNAGAAGINGNLNEGVNNTNYFSNGYFSNNIYGANNNIYYYRLQWKTMAIMARNYLMIWINHRITNTINQI